MMHQTIENKCYFLTSVKSINSLPKESLNEIGFWGRSNVGKSSLLNCLTKSRIAKTSKTPGRTTSINFFEIEKKIRLIDFPGYGFAKRSKVEIYEWNKLIIDYLSIRRSLFSIFLLIDSRHGLKKIDISAIELLEKLNKNFFVVLTKIDKVSKDDLENCYESVCININESIFANKKVFLTSSKKNKGIKELRKNILDVI